MHSAAGVPSDKSSLLGWEQSRRICGCSCLCFFQRKITTQLLLLERKVFCGLFGVDLFVVGGTLDEVHVAASGEAERNRLFGVVVHCRSFSLRIKLCYCILNRISTFRRFLAGRPSFMAGSNRYCRTTFVPSSLILCAQKTLQDALSISTIGRRL